MNCLQLPAYSKKILSNGLTVFFMNYPKYPLVHFRFFLKKGAMCDSADKEGLSKLTAAVLKKGTKKYNALELFDEIDLLGGDISCTADIDNSLAYGGFLSKNCGKGLELFSEIIMNPAFDDEEIERQKMNVTGEIIAHKDNPSAIANLHFSRFLFCGHPYGRPVSGTESSVAGITGEDVRNFYKLRYSPGNSILVIAGDFNEDSVIKQIEAGFGQWTSCPVGTQSGTEVKQAEGINILIVDKDDASQTQIRLGNVGVRRNTEDYYAVRILSNILGGGFNSRLNNEVRVKRGLTYGIVSRFNMFLHSGEFTVNTFTKNESVGESIEIIISELEKIKSEPVTGKELDGSKKYITGLFPLTIETIELMAKHVTDCEFYGLDEKFVERFNDNIMSVNADDIIKAAQKYIETKNFSVAAVGKMNDIKSALEKLGKVTCKNYTDEV